MGSFRGGFGAGILASPEELPTVSHRVVRALFVLLQLMYLAFYVGALANLGEIEDLLSALPATEILSDAECDGGDPDSGTRAFVLLPATCCFVRHVRRTILRLWPFLLLLDLLWALSPFLLLHHISFGLALACTALLVYSLFAQRSLVLMGAAAERGAAATQG